MAICFAIVAMVWALRYPASAPREDPASWKERIYCLKKVWSALVIIISMMGTIYFGIATVTEAAALGAAAAFIMALLSKRLTRQVFTKTIFDTVKTAAFIMFIAVGGKMLGFTLTYFGIPQKVSDIILESHLNRYMIIIMMMLFYIVLGMFIDAIGMIVITMPIYFPILLALGFDPIWFGIMLLINIEIGLVSPPFALNVYIVKGACPELPLKEIFSGSLVFISAAVFMIALIMIYPEIALWLPRQMYH
jgi:tripartite ATP-independent transporter DctM subunit